MDLIAMTQRAVLSRKEALRQSATKIALIMRLTVFLIIAATLNVSARSFAQNISLSLKNASLSVAFESIQAQSDFVFFYDKDLVLRSKPVTLEVRNMPLKEALMRCLENQQMEFAIKENLIWIRPVTASFPVTQVMIDDLAPMIRVTGRVTDESGHALPGITVYVRLKNTPQVAIAIPMASAGIPSATVPANESPVASSEPLPATVAAGVPAQSRASGNMGTITATMGNVTITDENGAFEIWVDNPRATLAFSSVNMQLNEVKLNGRNVVNVVMKPKIDEYQSMVVKINTGFQIKPKERATGSFGKPDMKVFANRSGTLDLVARLDGQVAGLTVNTGLNGSRYNTNGNGTSTQSALIRGKSSVFLDSEPLYVINGVIANDFSSINMDDVDDITVLKDAAAAAIWGSRAANGVIVVTTKSGSRDQKVHVSYSGFATFNGKPDFDYSPHLNSKQYIKVARDIFDSTKNDNPWSSVSMDFVAPHDLILYNRERGLISAAQANASLDSLSNIDNLGQILGIWYRNSITTTHTVSVSGGGSMYNFYGSLNYTGVQSSDPGAKDNTYRLDFGQEFNPNRGVKISLNTSLTNRISSGKNPISIGNSFLPYQLFKDAQGNSIDMPYIRGLTDSVRSDYEARSRISLGYNPLEEMNTKHSNSNNMTISVTANAGIKLWKGLSFQGTYGYLTSPGTSTSYTDHTNFDLRKELVSLTFAPDINSVPEYLLPTEGGSYFMSTNNQRNWTVRNQLIYNLNGRGGNDLLNLQFGQDASESVANRTQNLLRGYDENLQTYTVIDISKFGSGFVSGTVPGYGFYSSSPFTLEETRSRYTSWFGLASYTLNHKYTVDASWREDHASLFGNDVSAQNRPVYSFGAKWDITGEKFMKPITWLNQLQLRATYGITGNSPSNNSTTKTVVRPEFVYSPPLIGGQAYALSSAANTKLTWESTHTRNIGVDFSVLNNRLGGSVEYYHKNTTGLLGNAALDPFTGVNSAIANIGNCTNTGLEMTLRSTNVKTKNFEWSSSFVISHNESKLVTYSKPSSYSLTASARIYAPNVIGYSMNSLWAYRYAGLDNVGDPQIYLNDKTVTKTPYVGGVDDVAHMGTTIPVVNGGFSNSFNYKGFDLAVNMVYSFGAVMRRDVNRFYNNRLAYSTGWGGNELTPEFLTTWKQPGDEARTNTPAYRADGYYNYSQRDVNYFTSADINVVSASYIKIRDVSLSYNINHSLVQWMGIQGATMRFQINNFLVWKNNKYGIDPEYQDFMNGYRGVRTNQHSITLGVNVNF